MEPFKKLRGAKKEAARQAAFNGDAAAARALYQDAVARGYRVLACIRYVHAARLGAAMDHEETAYREQAWGSLGQRGRAKVMRILEGK